MGEGIATSPFLNQGPGEPYFPSPRPSPLKGRGRKGDIMTIINPARGEAALRVNGCELRLRPSFEALVAAEGELGPLFALVERAADGRLGLGELAALFWHCIRDRDAGMTREAVGEALVEQGLAAVTPALRVLLGQILQGR